MRIDPELKALADVVGLTLSTGDYSSEISVYQPNADRALYTSDDGNCIRAFLYGWAACCANR
jgi:hypothetical protein